MMDNDISIALATYNGEKYINELLDSINQQTYKNFILHICDDGSTDNTVNAIQSHPLFLNGKAIIHSCDGGLGALRNFKRTITYCNTKYICPCDQDDYWESSKLETLYRFIKEKEAEQNKPILIFSDLEIVDSELNCIHESFYSVSNKSRECHNPEDFLISNHIPGCVMMFNHELKVIFEPIPDDVRMHDWWIALIAAYYGEIFYCNATLIKYRQHGGNVVGASGMLNFGGIKLSVLKNIPESLRRSKNITRRFSERYKLLPKISNEHQKFLDLALGEISLRNRFSLLKSSKSGEAGLLRNIVWWFI
jgi:glycosyltransferase involved in cell wall biosynthesis